MSHDVEREIRKSEMRERERNAAMPADVERGMSHGKREIG